MPAIPSGSGRVPALGITPPIRLPARGGGRLRPRLRAWLRRSDLDSQLADGADSRGSPELTARAAQLTTARVRRSLAAGIERILEEGQRPARALSSAAPVNRTEIGPARLLLEAAARQLDGAGPVTAQGVVLIARLLTDPASSLYNFSGDGTLTREAALALAALQSVPRDR